MIGAAPRRRAAVGGGGMSGWDAHSSAPCLPRLTPGLRSVQVHTASSRRNDVTIPQGDPRGQSGCRRCACCMVRRRVERRFPDGSQPQVRARRTGLTRQEGLHAHGAVPGHRRGRLSARFDQGVDPQSRRHPQPCDRHPGAVSQHACRRHLDVAWCPFVVAGFRRSENVAGCAILLVAMLVGWFGLVTAWRLYHALLNGRTDFNRRVAWSGLACGSIVSVFLILASNGTLVFRIGFFGWPLLAAFFYAAWLRCKCPVGARAWRAA